MDRAERVLEELAASREYRRVALDHLVSIYEAQARLGEGAQGISRAAAGGATERGRVAAHYLCELAEHALLQGEPERARTLLRQARTHQRIAAARRYADRASRRRAPATPPVRCCSTCRRSRPPRVSRSRSFPRCSPSPARPPAATCCRSSGGGCVRAAASAPRQLAWLLATAVPPEELARLPAITADFGCGLESAAEASSLSVLLTRIGDAGGRYQCDDCGLNSVGWYWRCPKCRSWDSMCPAVFKWAERADHGVRLS